MLRKFSLIGGVAAALLFVLPADAGSAFNGATNPGGKYVPYGGGLGKFHTLIQAANTFIAVTGASSTPIPVASTSIPTRRSGELATFMRAFGRKGRQHRLS
jgi:hypothetical protein